MQSSAKRNEGTRAQQNRYRVTAARQTGAHEFSRLPLVNVKNIWTQSSLSLALGRGGVSIEISISSRLSGQSVIYQKKSIPPEHAAHVLEEREGPNLEAVR